MVYDIAIIGAGAVGLATAYQILIQRPKLRVCVIEKENEVAAHQTGNNSNVIHSGIYYKPRGSKALNCKRGYELLLDFCEKEGVEYDLCGKVIVATDEWELPILKGIYERGIKNGLQQIAMINTEKLKEIEPHCAGIQAIKVPEAGIIDYKVLAQKYAQRVKELGGDLYLNTKVLDIKELSSEVVVVSDNQEIKSKVVVACAGLYADKIAQKTLSDINFITAPFRGEYYELTPESASLVNGLIYPVPDPNFPFLGVHFTKMIKGGVEAGPNAVLAFKREGYQNTQIDIKELLEIIKHKGFRKVAQKHWKKELYEIYRSFSKTAFLKTLQRLIPELTGDNLVKGGAGVRAQAIDAKGNLIDDFLILSSKRTIHICNAPSPAATASLAIGENIARQSLAKLSDL